MRERFPSIDADDVIQETFIALCKVLPSYSYEPDEKGHFRNYLTGILRNKAMRTLRKERQNAELMVDMRRDGVIAPYQRRGLIIQYLILYLSTREGRLALKALVCHSRERIDVLRGLRRISIQLLWRHVKERARRHLARHARHRLLNLAGDAKVEDVGRAVFRDHYVAGLYIAMDDAFRVSVV